jgi:hypothetical protein
MFCHLHRPMNINTSPALSLSGDHVSWIAQHNRSRISACVGSGKTGFPLMWELPVPLELSNCSPSTSSCWLREPGVSGRKALCNVSKPGELTSTEYGYIAPRIEASPLGHFQQLHRRTTHLFRQFNEVRHWNFCFLYENWSISDSKQPC